MLQWARQAEKPHGQGKHFFDLAVSCIVANAAAANLGEDSMTTLKGAERGYSAAHFVLELDGQQIPQLIRSIEGGGVKCDILTYRSGRSPEQFRQLSRPKYEDLKLQISPSMSEPFYKWVAGFFQGKVERRNGAICAGDFKYAERARREFFDALISSFDWPAMDANQKESAFITVSMKPERIRFAVGSGKTMPQVVGRGATRLWLPSNFAFTIKGFEDACKRVVKVDGFSIKLNKVMEYQAGNMIDPINIPGYLEFPNVTFQLPEANAQPFIDHFTKHVINGQKQTSTRLTGNLTMRDHASSDLCGIDFEGIDIANVTPDKAEASADGFKMVKVEISVEKMKFKYLRGSKDVG